MALKYFECFAGIGGFSLGFPKDWKCIGFSEIDKYASSILKYHYPNIKNYGDITKIDWAQIEDFDLLCGGWPCTQISAAGKQTGLAGKDSGLFSEIVKCLSIKKPQYVMLENVPNLLKVNKGKDFERVTVELVELGYDLWWQVIDTKSFGYPLSRPRCIILGNRGKGWEQKVPITAEDGIFKKALSTKTYESLLQFCRSDFKGPSKQRIRLLLQDERGIRVPTPLERERIMGFPDFFTKYGIDKNDNIVTISDTQRICMTGNAVATYVIKFVTDYYFN